MVATRSSSSSPASPAPASPAPASPTVDPRFGHGSYVIKRPWISWLGRTFRVFAPDGSLALFVRHPVFRLRDEWKICADEAQTQPLVGVKAQRIIALNYQYDLTDLTNGVKIGGVRTKGLKSLFRDHIEIIDAEGQVIGHLIERGASVLRRFLPFLTSRHEIEIGGRVVASVQQKFRFFIKEFHVDQTGLVFGDDDPRLVLVCALLAVVMESHREDG